MIKLIKNIKFLRILLCLVLMHTKVFGQGSTTSMVNGDATLKQLAFASSPTVNGFRTFGEFAPSNFIGVVDITVPVHTVTYKNFSMPIVLRYHSGMGNKVEAYAGAVGLGWHLNSGGVISLIKSKIDAISYDTEFTRYTSEANLTGRSDWSSKTYLNTLIGGTASGLTRNSYNVVTAMSNYSFSINFLDYSGELYFDHNNEAKFRTTSDKKLILKGVSFFTTNNNSVSTGIRGFTIIDEQGIEYIFGEDVNGIETTYQGHRPTLKAPLASDRPSTEEFYRLIHGTSTAWHLTSIKFPNSEEIKFTYQKEPRFYWTKVFTDLKTGRTARKEENDFLRNRYLVLNDEQATIVVPVNLKKIETPNTKLAFEYSTSSDATKNIGDYEVLNLGVYTNIGLGGDKNGYLGVELMHKNIASNQHGPGRLSTAEAKKGLRKLDNILVYNKKNEIEKQIDFTYTTASYERRKLLGVNIKEYGKSQNEKYLFKYDMSETHSPDPTGYNKDDYGFYTTKKNYNGYINTPLNRAVLVGPNDYLFPFASDVNLRNQYYENRKPEVSRFNTWEILTEITYPTGGKTKFEYEANMYGSIAKNYPFTVVANFDGSEKPAGGVRIKSVKSFDSNNNLAKSMSYKYTKQYAENGMLSSGILTHVPTYFDISTGNLTSDWNLDYKRWSTEDIYPADRLRGNHITYSEVTAIDDMDGSFTTFKYKNFDNGYHDREALDYASHYKDELYDENGVLKNVWEKRDVISMGLERGQLLSKTYYKPVKNTIGKRGEMVKEIIYQYNNDQNRFNDNIRVLNLYENAYYDNLVTKTLHAFTYMASFIYTYHPYLQKETEIDYIGTKSILKRETSYKYNDKYKTLIEKEEKLGDKTYKTTYKYPFDFETQSVYKSMVNKHWIAPVVSEEHFVNNERVFSQRNNYRMRISFQIAGEGTSTTQNSNATVLEPLGANFPVLGSIEKQVKHGNWEKEVEFLDYDEKHNLLNYKNKSGKETSYIWGYNQSLPVWTIDNIPYANVKTALGDEIASIGSSLYPSETDLQTINTRFKASGIFQYAFINHYLYDPLKGMIYKENERGVKEYYEYDGFGRLIKVEDTKKNTVIKYEYNFKN